MRCTKKLTLEYFCYKYGKIRELASFTHNFYPGRGQGKIFISLFLPIKILARHRMENKLYEYYLCNLMAI